MFRELALFPSSGDWSLFVATVMMVCLERWLYIVGLGDCESELESKYNKTIVV